MAQHTSPSLFPEGRFLNPWLHREGTHASRRTVNQDLLSRLNLSFVAKTLQCGECPHRSRLLEGNVIRLHREFRLGSARILCKGPRARAEHLVAWLELGYVPAHRFDLAGHVMPEPARRCSFGGTFGESCTVLHTYTASGPRDLIRICTDRGGPAQSAMEAESVSNTGPFPERYRVNHERDAAS